MSQFVAETATRRCRSGDVGSGLWALALAGVAVWIVVGGLLPALSERTTLFGYGSKMYRAAQWASSSTLAAICAIVAAFAAWLVAGGLRAAFGVPPRRMRWFWFRVVVTAPVAIWLIFRASDEFHSRNWETFWPFVFSLAVCLLFAADVPLIIRDVVAVLRARIPLVGVKRRPIREAKAGQRVWLRGIVERLDTTELELRDADGDSVVVELDPARMVVEGAAARVGAAAEVIGVVAGHDDAYRGAKRLSAGRGRLFLFVDAQAMHRRFLLAAVIESVAAAGLLVAPAAYVYAVDYFGKLARVGSLWSQLQM